MQKRGAQNFAFMSRTGTDKEEAALVVKELVAKGASVQVYRGDASIEADVNNTISEVQKTHPIRGVVHAAMVLQVSNDPTNRWVTC